MTNDECRKMILFQIPDAPAEEAVRIFVEFKRVESAVKGMSIVSDLVEWFRSKEIVWYDVRIPFEESLCYDDLNDRYDTNL